MSGSDTPPDHSVELAQIDAKAQADARAAQAAKEAADRARFEASLGSAYNGAIASARDYFSQRGLNPDDYVSAIQQGASRARSMVPDMAAAPGTYFDNLGASVFDSAQGGKRAEFQRLINSFAPGGFENRSIADTADDATLESILQEQRQTADNYIRNLLDRGVITSTGYQAAADNVKGQEAGARARLQEAGNTVLNSGRTRLRNIANQAREGAANYALGDNFNPFQYSSDIDTALGDFFNGLGNSIRGAVPNGLFSTSGLAGIAGAGQGAQNTKFDPNALAGLFSNEDDSSKPRSDLTAF